jgi:hypothetical protein
VPWVVLMLALAAGLRADTCPDAPLAAAACELDALRASLSCASGRTRGSIGRTLGRIGRTLNKAERASTRGAAKRTTVQVARAERIVATLAARVETLGSDGRLAAPCAAAMAAPLAALGQALAEAALGPPAATTTTLAVPATTTSTTVPPTTTSTTSTPTTTTATTTVPLCGNGRLDPGEQCDGTDLFGRTCLTLGFDGGELGCRPDCLFDISRCHF